VKLLVIDRTRSRTAPVKRTVVAQWVRVGRDANCEIHLPDPRIPLAQAMIVDRDGLVYIEGEGTGGPRQTTQKTVRSVRLKPGEPLAVGPYRFEVQAAPPGYDAALSVEVTSAPEIGPDLATRTAKQTLDSLGVSKRALAWTLGLLILALFFALPAGRVLDLPWRHLAQASALGDRLWNPGPLVLAHQPIEARCASCHEVAFEHVRDAACLECHRAIGHHVGPGLQPAALFAGARCTTCHREHKGTKTTHRDDDGFCVACHRDIRGKSKATASANVTDFAKDHPAFRLTLPAPGGVLRVRQSTAALSEPSNLVFPHAVHLDPAGVRSPLQGRMKLECRSCHQPDASRRTFEPISMPRHCQECHNLQFEPAVTTREVAHGRPADAVTTIEEFYATLALRGVPDSFQKAFGIPGEGLLRRVGEPTAEERRSALALASRKAEQVAKELFEVRVCKTCHQVERAGPAEGWQVAPVRASHRWMPQARFDHKPHAQAKCASCHEVAKSKRSSDVAMPTIERCRECHAGSRPSLERVTSNCLLCHGFHVAGHAWDPGFKPKGTTRVVEAR
jgi:predicted CXXCH cytochrome family protein